MAGKLILIVATCTLLSAGLSGSYGQSPDIPPKRPGWFGGDGSEKRRPRGDPADFEKFENVRKAIEALTPEQQKRFQENFLRWSNLSPEEKKALADRDGFRRKKMAEGIDAALKEAGLELDAERREIFAKRYGEERHKIEDQLRKDMDEKRQTLLKEVIAKLKAEFASGAAPESAEAPRPPVKTQDPTVPPPQPKP